MLLGSGCSSAKCCLTIDQINLKGVVKADWGMIAVVVNTVEMLTSCGKRSCVQRLLLVRITGRFDPFSRKRCRTGKSFTREVTKKITTSAV